MGRRVLLALLALCAGGAVGECNKTKYWMWYNSDYIEETENTQYMIKVDKQTGFWGVTETLRYSPEPYYGQVMDKAAAICQRSLEVLKRDLSGRHGEVLASAPPAPRVRAARGRADARRLSVGGRSSARCAPTSARTRTSSTSRR